MTRPDELKELQLLLNEVAKVHPMERVDGYCVTCVTPSPCPVVRLFRLCVMKQITINNMRDGRGKRER